MRIMQTLGISKHLTAKLQIVLRTDSNLSACVACQPVTQTGMRQRPLSLLPPWFTFLPVSDANKRPFIRWPWPGRTFEVFLRSEFVCYKLKKRNALSVILGQNECAIKQLILFTVVLWRWQTKLSKLGECCLGWDKQSFKTKSVGATDIRECFVDKVTGPSGGPVGTDWDSGFRPPRSSDSETRDSGPDIRGRDQRLASCCVPPHPETEFHNGIIQQQWVLSLSGLAL